MFFTSDFRRQNSNFFLPRSRSGLGLIALIACLSLSAEAHQDAEPVAKEVLDAPADPLPPLEQPEKKRQAMAGLAAVAGIAIVGIALLTLTILWAARLRRINRQPLPDAPLKNELWFLKPPKEPPPSSLPPETPS